MKRFDLSPLAPPGFPLRRELHVFLAGEALALLWSFQFLLNYMNCYLNLFFWSDGDRWLRQGAVMLAFPDLLESSLWGFFIVAVCMLLCAVSHYVYHWQGSRSIDLMRRLPRRGELWKRCLSLPLLEAGLALLSALPVRLIYLLIYRYVTPAECIPLIWR